MSYVTATAIVGPTEMILVDALYHRGDAERMADSLAKLGKRLKAIVVTHPHEDHYFGAAAVAKRFPSVPVYMTRAGADEFRRTFQFFLDDLRRKAPAELPDSLISPTVLTSMTLTVDGERIEIIPDLQGDVYTTSNSIVWIPSLRTALVGDIVFNGTHAWAGTSDSTTRARWRESIARITQLKPAVVIAGHRAPSAADTPDVLRAMDNYLADFDAAVAESPDPDALVAKMRAKYPTYLGVNLLRGSAGLVVRGRKKPPM
jgi:glyoxylase-like metal-dependent hydrolase (beta-lactamase superfamily II)